jgi:hypothetical protein
MSILSSPITGKYYFEDIEKKLLEQIKQWLEEYRIKNYKLNKSENSTLESPKFTIKVDAQDVNLVGYRDEELPKIYQF